MLCTHVNTHGCWLLAASFGPWCCLSWCLASCAVPLLCNCAVAHACPTHAHTCCTASFGSCCRLPWCLASCTAPLLCYCALAHVFFTPAYTLCPWMLGFVNIQHDEAQTLDLGYHEHKLSKHWRHDVHMLYKHGYLFLHLGVCHIFFNRFFFWCL